jgi:DnaJ-class molecular chaperone
MEDLYLFNIHLINQLLRVGFVFFSFELKINFIGFLIDSMKKIANQGMISMETHHTGDLIIQFDVEFPSINFFNDQSILQV